MFLGIGANIDPEANIIRAVRRLRECLRITGISTIYRTPAIGRTDQPPYLNGVVMGYTGLRPRTLKYDRLREIERRLGRVRTGDKYAARPIDLDLLLYGGERIDEAGLQVPDPELFDRAFLAAGVQELAPGLKLPGTGQTIEQLVAALNAPLESLPEFTLTLKEIISA